ncbi:MFS transporter [Streptomyces hebeiensis]
MPLVLYVLALAVFAQGTSEFMLSGLVPDIARDLQVSVPAAGALTSAFAVGMIVGAPLMAVVGLRWSRRRALLVFLVVFLLVHVVGAVTTSFPVLLATRVVAALANAGFLAVALATASVLAGPRATGRATSILLGGVTAACVAGVPAGALLGQWWGWRSAFWAVAAVSVPAVVAIVRSVPGDAAHADGARPATGAAGTPGPTVAPGPAEPDGTPRSAEGTGAREELRALRSTRLVVTLVLGALVNGATFCTFTYLAPLVTSVSGIGHAWVPAVLALFGIGSFLGVTLGGRFADTRPLPLLVGGGAALLVGWGVFAVTAQSPVTALVLVLVQGTLSFAVGSTLIARALYEATGAPTFAGACATAALNVGAAAGPWLGGLAISAGFGYRSPVWVSALLVAFALAVAALATGLRRVGATRRTEAAAPTA